MTLIPFLTQVIAVERAHRFAMWAPIPWLHLLLGYSFGAGAAAASRQRCSRRWCDHPAAQAFPSESELKWASRELGTRVQG
jgi:hypothetical protein